MNWFERIKEYKSNKNMSILKSTDCVVLKFNNYYTLIQRPTSDIPKGRIIEFIDEDKVTYDKEYTEKKAEWIEAIMHLEKDLFTL